MNGLPIETRPLGGLRPHPRNYRQHPEEQIVHLVASLRAHGFVRPVVVSSDGVILCGHGLVAAAAKLGIEEGPILTVPYEHDAPEALHLLAADNESWRLGAPDYGELLRLLEEVDTSLSLEGTGFDEKTLAGLRAFCTPPTTDLDLRLDPDLEWTEAGLPEYLGPRELPPRLVLSFRSPEQRDELIERLGIKARKPTGKTSAWSAWWPPEEGEE